MKLPNHVSESIKRLNPELYVGHGVGTVETQIPKPTAACALERHGSKLKGRTRSVRTVVQVTFIGFLRREYDSDNFIGSIKPLRDSVAEWLGIDDGDARVRWQYQQVQTKGEEGVLVRIETL